MSMYPPPAPRPRSVTGTVLKVLGVLFLVFVGLCVLGLVGAVVLLQLT